jgi:hypothetical protein
MLLIVISHTNIFKVPEVPKKIIQEEKLPVVLPEDTEIYSEFKEANDSPSFCLCSESTVSVNIELKCKYTNIFIKSHAC